VAVAYLRVSTDDQQLGPEAQRAAIEAWAARGGVRIASWHTDQGVSGSAPLERRPALLAAIDEVTACQAGVLIVARRDRLARDVILAAMVERLCERKGTRLISAAGEGTEGASADEPTGQLMRHIVDAFAEYERALIRTRTRVALEAKRARGERAGTVPWGFREGENRRLVPDEREQAALRLAAVLRTEGRSYRQIVAHLRETGVANRRGRPLGLTEVYLMLGRAAPDPGGGADRPPPPVEDGP
jgi:DNA invertase Pin-like site-specific DNA recombinase